MSTIESHSILQVAYLVCSVVNLNKCPNKKFFLGNLNVIASILPLMSKEIKYCSFCRKSGDVVWAKWGGGEEEIGGVFRIFAAVSAIKFDL